MTAGKDKEALPVREGSGISDASESLSPAEKRRRTEASFTRKVELLEAWATSSPPDGQWWPRNPTDLRKWHDPDGLGVRAWSSPNVATLSSPYADLRRRFDAAVATLASNRPQKPLSELAAEKAARVQAEARVAALAAQNAALLDRLRRKEVEMDAVRAARDAAQARVRDYEQTFGRIRPLSASRPDGA